MSERTLCVLPEPKELTWLEGAFELDADTRILLPPTAGEAAVAAARSLQGEIAAATGLHAAIERTSSPAATENVILLYDDPVACAAYWGQALPDAAWLAGRGEEAHLVRIAPERVVAGGVGGVAVHHAVQTLRQIARSEGARWPALAVRDWPTLAYRGLMLDVSRAKVPTVATLKALVDELAFYKANVLQLYTEHTFAFPHHPRIGAGCGVLTSEDILELDAYAAAQHVELMPNLNSFGHCGHLLALPEYAHLSESPVGWTLSPVDEGTYALLADLYADMLPAFRSRTLNAGCDETWDLGKGRSKPLADEIGTGRVYLGHILRLHELAAKHGCRLQIWGDILLHYPELVAEVPEDITLLDWHYEAQDDYPSVRLFAESGRDFWVCPGTSSWNTLFPRVENSNANIRNLARQGAAHGASGLLNTDWGDHGHYQPIGQCWYGYAFGACQAWSGGETDDAAFDPRFGRLYYGPRGPEVVEAMRAIGRLNALPSMALPNATRSVYLLLDDPLTGGATAAVPADVLETVIETCRQAESVWRDAAATSIDRASLAEMAHSARLMAYAAEKALAGQRLRADLAEVTAGRAPAEERLAPWVPALRALEADLTPLAETLREQWLARARHSEIEVTMGHLRGAQERLALACAWLAERLEAARAGSPASFALEGYAREAGPHEVLGQAFWRRWRELGLAP